MMEILIKPLAILILVILLMYIAAKLMQKLSSKFLKSTLGTNKDMKLQKIFYIDNNNKIVSLQHKEKSYLILLSKSNNILLDKNEV